MVAPDAATFAERILTLLDNEALRDRLGVAGRQYAEQHHDWRVRGEQLETIYREQIERRRVLRHD
jgi:glycosyltransferase involved in cell wall biosynthesis